MAKIRNEELGHLAGEVLPERTVLSALPTASDPSSGAPFSPFCSPNNQTNSVASSIVAIQGANAQCGLTNTGNAAGVSVMA